MLRMGRILRMRAPGEDAGRETGKAAAARSLSIGEDALQAALERKPAVRPPAEFARRVALLAAAQPQSSPSRVGGYARSTALVALVVIAVTLFALAPRVQASFSNFLFDLELAILAQLAVLAWWLGTRAGHEQ